MKMKVIAILNTDCSLKTVDYGIVANDASISSISFFMNAIKQAYKDGLEGEKESK